MSEKLVKLRVLQSFATLVDGVAIVPDTGTVIERSPREARRLERAGLADPILSKEEQLVRAAKALGVGLVSNRASVISAAKAAGVGYVDQRVKPRDKGEASAPEA